MPRACVNEDEILALLDGRLGGAETAELEAHADGCLACRLLLGESCRILCPGGADGDIAVADTDFAVAGQGRGVLPPGSTFGRYEIIQLLGAGGMGVVYRARDPVLHREVALKLVRVQGADAETNAALRGRLLREARVMARLSHPNVVTVFEVSTVDDQLCIAMELVDGCNARDWLAERQPSWSEVLRVYRLAGEGLVAAHAQGIIHRDFKPDNVLIGGDGRVRVSDFGIAAAAVPSTGQQRLTATGMVLGTPGYMPPEQLQGLPVDERADVYAFSVALFEALYGRLPHGSATVDELRQAASAGVATAEAEGPVPRWIGEVLQRGFAPTPGARPPSMAALLQQLSGPPRRRRLAVAAGLAVVVLFGGGLLAWSRGAPPSPCGDTTRRLEGIWDGPRQEALREAFRRTGRAHAADLATTVEHLLDGYTARWIAEHHRACEATWVARRASEELFARRARCLGQRLDGVRLLIDQLLAGDAVRLDSSVEAVTALATVESCTDPAARGAPPRPSTVGVADSGLPTGGGLPGDGGSNDSSLGKHPRPPGPPSVIPGPRRPKPKPPDRSLEGFEL